MKINDNFLKFYKNIQLTSSQREDAITKYTGVCKKLHGYYYPNVEYNGNTKLLIGSYGKRTNIRPPRDVDVLFIMPNDKFEQYDDNQSNGQSQLLQDIKKILSEKYSTTDKIKGWGKVVLVRFADGTHNIELLPAWEKANGKFIIPNTKNGGYWENWDPRSGIQRINNSDSQTGKTRSLIRMIKKWSENCTVKLNSYQIENKVLDFLTNDTKKEYPILVRDFFKFFYRTANDEDLLSYVSTALNRATNACEYEDNDNLEKAIKEWRKIFGDDFPATLEKGFYISLEETPSLADYSHCEPLRWPLIATNRVSVDAYIYNINKTKKLGGINSNGRNLSKDLYLKFVAKTNVKGEFQYYWQVVNTGQEAKSALDLRGKFFVGEQIQWEHTKYNGKHWVECFIVQNNTCVGRSEKFFINIK